MTNQIERDSAKKQLTLGNSEHTVSIVGSHSFPDGSNAVLFGNTVNEPGSWVVLRPGERIIQTQLTPDIVGWFEQRTNQPLAAAPEVPITMIVDPAKPLGSRIINPLENTISSNAYAKPFEKLEGVNSDQTLAAKQNGADTAEIAQQKAEAKQRLNPLVTAQLTEGQALQIPRGPDRVFLTLATDEMVAASAVEGDPSPENQNAKLKGKAHLLQSGELLLVQRDQVGNLTYLTPAWGKVKTEVPNLTDWNPDGGGPLGKRLDSSLQSTQGLDTKTARDVKQKVVGHLMKKLQQQSVIVFPQVEATPPATFDLSQLERNQYADVRPELAEFLHTQVIPARLIHLKKARTFAQLLTRKGLLDERNNIIEGTDLSTQLSDRALAFARSFEDERLGHIVKEGKSVPTIVDNQGNIDYMQLNAQPENVIEMLFANPVENWADILLRRRVISQELPNLVDEYKRKAGYVQIGGARAAEQQLTELFREHIHAFNRIPWETIPRYIQSLPEEVMRNKGLVYWEDMNNKPGDVKAKSHELAKFLTANQFDMQIMQEANNYEGTDYDSLPDTPRIDYQRVYARAENLLIPEVEAQTVFTMAERQAREMDRCGVEGIMYSTPQTRERSKQLKEAGYPDALGRVPWMMTEGAAIVHERQRLESFIGGISLAGTFAKNIYHTPEQLAQECKFAPGSPEYQRLMEMSAMVRGVLDWKMPHYLPKKPGLDMPLVMTRPDLARVERDGEIQWVATELESSPGGLGMQKLLYEAFGYGEYSNVAATMKDFMQNVPLFGEMKAKVNRNKLTIFMTNEWAEYRNDLLIFQQEMRDLGTQVDLVTVEELMDNPDSSTRVESGFVFHFAYPWNFIKDPDKYHINMLLNPNRVSEVLGLPIEKVVQPGLLNPDGTLNQKQLDSVMRHIKMETDREFSLTGVPPIGNWESRLKAFIYREDIQSVESTNDRHKGLTNKKLTDIARMTAQHMASVTTDVYNRQGKDLFMFNDPLFSAFTHSKLGMSVFHLPGFMQSFAESVTALGFDRNEVDQSVDALKHMTAETHILVSPSDTTQSEMLTRHSHQMFQGAMINKDQYVLKVAVDPQFGMYDWGARGIWIGPAMTQEDWQAVLLKASKAGIPYILQEVVNNVPYDGERATNTAGNYDINTREEIGVYNVDQHNPTYEVGDVYKQPARARFNPFLFGAMSGRKGQMDTFAGNGLITLTPSNDDDPLTKVHGASISSMGPAVID